MSYGYLIHAQNSSNVDYVKCATVLAHSIKSVMPDSNISILTNDKVDNDIFDNVIKLPFKDNEYKMANDWQVYYSSPYDYTIKLEADLYIPRRIDHWWDILKYKDICISTTIRNYKNEISDVLYYRRSITDSNLVNTYNAITYFKKSDLAENFYNIVNNIFENWEEYKKNTNIRDKLPTTDVVYAIASTIIGRENTTLPKFTDMSMIHMKKMINNNFKEDWTKELLYEVHEDCIRINTFTVRYPLHYHIKNFSNNLWDELYA